MLHHKTTLVCNQGERGRRHLAVPVYKCSAHFQPGLPGLAIVFPHVLDSWTESCLQITVRDFPVTDRLSLSLALCCE